jgi:hypothetical protein
VRCTVAPSNESSWDRRHQNVDRASWWWAVCRTSEPPKPARPPHNNKSLPMLMGAERHAAFSTIRLMKLTSPIKTPPARDRPRPRGETPPFVPRGTVRRLVMRRGGDGDRMPSFVCFIRWQAILRSKIVDSGHKRKKVQTSLASVSPKQAPKKLSTCHQCAVFIDL